MRLLSTLAGFVLLTADVLAVRYHVNAAATGSGTGLSWSNAFTELQAALSIVVQGDEIWVAAGNYKPTSGTDRSIAFVLRNGVDLYGGFAGTETQLDQRDIDANPTLLNGDIGALGQTTDNSHNVVRANNITTFIILDGFRIINGYSSGGNNGGGLRVTNALGGELLVRNCQFINNYAVNYGGGIYLAAANLRIEDCVFNGNQTSSSGNGGAIFNGNNNNGNSTLSITGCVFVNNTARIGACLDNSLRYTSLLIDRCIFTNNVGTINVMNIDEFDTARLLNSYWIGNRVGDSGGAVLYLNSFYSTEDLLMVNCTVADNFNLHTGTIIHPMIRLLETYYTVHNCIFHGNTPVAGRQVTAAPYITHSIVQGGHTNGLAIVDADPEFADRYSGAPAAFDARNLDYRPLPSSPAINAGDNVHVLPGHEFDLVGDARIQGGVVDMGCYESDLSVSALSRSMPATLYFDHVQGAIIVHEASLVDGRELLVISSDGRSVHRQPITRGLMRMNLGPGVYIATASGLIPLKFIVSGH